MSVVGALAADGEVFFGIQVTDEATGRGVPMATLETPNKIRLVTDSAGWVALDEVGLMNRRVHFDITSPGYAFPKDRKGRTGASFVTKPGAAAEIKLIRTNIAERLHRLTGQGIYRHATRLGREVPLPRPNLNGGVLGHEHVQATLHRGRLFWLWAGTHLAADADRSARITAAFSDLPDHGGLDPSLGVHLDYLMSPDGDSLRPMITGLETAAPRIDGLLAAPLAGGGEHLLAHYIRMKTAAEMEDHGIVEFNDETGVFEPVTQLGAEFAWQSPRGQPVRVKNAEGDFFYFAAPFCTTRAPADHESLLNPSSYEALSWSAAENKWRWQKEAAPLSPADESSLLTAGTLPAAEARMQVRDAASGQPLRVHSGSVNWNAHRQRWIMLFTTAQDDDATGDVWYAESAQPHGPWQRAVKIATHPGQRFAHPCHHPFFDQESGRLIYFEGTYTSATPAAATPHYDTNQLAYRLDLTDPRLAPAQSGD